jgi:hypothetical protein
MNQVVAVFNDATARDAAIDPPAEGNVVFLRDANQVQFYDGSAWLPISGGFTDRAVITATDSSWSVPSLASTIVKVTVIGGGGGGGGFSPDGSDGGTTTFNAGGAGTVSASGGKGGSSTPPAPGDTSSNGTNGLNGLTSGNGGTGGQRTVSSEFNFGGSTGTGGEVNVAYLDLDGISTANVTIGAGGSGGGGNPSGGTGGDGEVIVEYVAG